MIDLEKQIRDYYEAIIDLVDVEQFALAPLSAAEQGSRRWRGWAVAVASAVLVLLIVGGGVLLMRGSDRPVADEPAPPTTVSETPTEPIQLESLVWSRVPHDEAVFSPSEVQDIKSVTVGGPGFVVVGQTNAPTAEGWPGDAAVWTSVDGITWSLVPNDEPPLGGPGFQMMQSVTVGGPGLVAVGFGWDEPDLVGSTAVVWTSVDGRVWSRLPFEQDAFGSPGYDGNGTVMNSVTVGGPGLVAVGSDGGVSAVWTSPDGVSWSRAPHNPDAFGTGQANRSASEMLGVTAGGPGLVAVGQVGEGVEEQSSAAVWTSADGITWSRVPHNGAVFGGTGIQAMNSVTPGGPGLVAVGIEEPNSVEAMGGAHAAVWTSPDGVTWSRVPHDESTFGGGEDDETHMDDVAAAGPGLVAVGATVWTSPDGITWTRVPDAESILGIGEMESVIAASPGLIAVGEVDDNAAVWIAVPAN